MGTQDQDLADGCPGDEDTSDVGFCYSTLSYSDIQSTSNPHPSASSCHSSTISTSEPIVDQPPSKRIHKSATSESEIELQKLVVLRELSNTVQSGFTSPGDAESIFGNQVAAELRQINENKSQKMYYDSFVWQTRARSKFDLPWTLPARNTLHTASTTSRASPNTIILSPRLQATSGSTAAGKFHVTAPCDGGKS